MGKIDLSTGISGIKLKNPLMAASGILGTSKGLMKRAEESGASGVITKTITVNPREGHPNPVIVKVNCGYLNSIGLSNPGIEYFVSHVIGKEKPVDVPLIVSIGPSNEEEARYMAKKLKDRPIDGLEINSSCPHVKGKGLTLLSDLELFSNIIRSVKREINKPLFVKLSAMVPDIVSCGKLAVKSGADGLVVTNTLRGLAIDIWSKKPILGGIYGGLSGPAIKPIALRCVYELYEELRNVTLIGVGGITSWKDVVEFLLAGASAVQLGTAIAYKGFNVFKNILVKLRKYMIKEGFYSIREMIGLSH